MKHHSIPTECGDCILLDIYCKIRDEIESNRERWETFARDCSQLDVFERVVKIDRVHLNRVDREKIMDEIFPFFFSHSLLAIPAETLKRVLIDKWDDIFPEFASDPRISKHHKWALRLEIISKFCQLSEILGAHLIAAQAVGDNYDNFYGYTSKLVEYDISDVVVFYQNVSTMSDEDLACIMAYPNIANQSEEGKELLEDSIFYLKADLSIIGEEYVKFKEFYNSYKHGCRLIFPESVKINGETFVACITFLTKKASPRRGGFFSMVGFKSEDFSSFFNLIEAINQILFVLINNRRERYLFSKGYSKDCSIYLYFPSDMKDLYRNRKVEFII